MNRRRHPCRCRFAHCHRCSWKGTILEGRIKNSQGDKIAMDKNRSLFFYSGFWLYERHSWCIFNNHPQSPCFIQNTNLKRFFHWGDAENVAFPGWSWAFVNNVLCWKNRFHHFRILAPILPLLYQVNWGEELAFSCSTGSCASRHRKHSSAERHFPQFPKSGWLVQVDLPQQQMWKQKLYF